MFGLSNDIVTETGINMVKLVLLVLAASIVVSLAAPGITSAKYNDSLIQH